MSKPTQNIMSSQTLISNILKTLKAFQCFRGLTEPTKPLKQLQNTVVGELILFLFVFLESQDAAFPKTLNTHFFRFSGLGLFINRLNKEA